MITTTTISTDGLSADWAPAPNPAIDVQSSSGMWTQDEHDGSLRVAGPSLGSLAYTVTSIASPTISDATWVQSAGLPIPDDVAQDLELPDQLPAVITQTATKVTAGLGTPIAKARALQAYFRSSGGFAYTTDTPDSEAVDGMDVIASFLERKSGYCIHFASAMTVLARSVGIPARIAIGYLPGSRDVDLQTGRAFYSETNQELHAWTQLYFPGIGWLDFDPTVSLGAPASYTLAPGSLPETTPGATPTPSASASAPRPSDTATTGPGALAPGSDPGAPSTPASLPAQALGWVLGILVVLAAPAITRAVRRRGRLTRIAAGASPPTAWAEVLDTARDLGMPSRRAETPRAFAARLATAWTPDARGALDRLVDAVERAAFAPNGRTIRGDATLAAQTSTVIAAIEASAGSRARWSGRLAPASLLPG